MHKIEELISLTIKACESWIKYDNDGLLRFIDPIDKHEISAHYGASHAATAFIILGKLRDDIALFNKGKTLLTSIIERWDTSTKLPNFHADFNNFALCVAYDSLTEIDLELCKKIKNKVCVTSDSTHNTVNWLPMRWFVNIKRYEWTFDEKYQKICEECRLKINQATNEDGGIEDLLPKGTSFNLQYNIASVAELQFMRCRGLDIEISKEMGFLLKSVAPDGDINYQGRGTNQIFAWGMWIYLLSSSQNEIETNKAISFLRNKVAIMLENNNIMLNNSKGEEKHLWWDYHYSSVYIAHFLFWLVLAKLDFKKKYIKIKKTNHNDTGLSIQQDSDYFISTFSGRKKYIAENGPIISAFWMKKYGVINKGVFGPWNGAFGNKYSSGDVVLRNYFGLLRLKSNYDLSKNRFFHKFFPNIKTNDYLSTIPIITDFIVRQELDCIIVKFYNTKLKKVILNFPVLDNIKKSPIISLKADNKPMMITNNLKIRTQYGWCNIFQSKVSKAEEWILKIQ